MIEEKNSNDKIWLSDDNLKIKLKKDNQNEWILWVSIDNRNICFSMLMNDFVNWCLEEMNTAISVDTSWNDHKGFRVHEKDRLITIQEIKRFVKEYDITPSQSSDKFLTEEWYG